MTEFKVGDFYEDSKNVFQGGFYLLLSLDYELDIKGYGWRSAYFSFYTEGEFKGASEKILLDVDIERLVKMGNIRNLLNIKTHD